MKKVGYVYMALGFEEKTTAKEAKKEIRSFLRRVRSYRDTHGMDTPTKKLQYIYAPPIEDFNGGTVIMTGMDMYKHNPRKLWKKGLITVLPIYTDRQNPKDVAADMVTLLPGAEWTSSRNLKSRYLKHVMKHLEEGVAG